VCQEEASSRQYRGVVGCRRKGGQDPATWGGAEWVVAEIALLEGALLEWWQNVGQLVKIVCFALR
jgi:hypothetical protein